MTTHTPGPWRWEFNAAHKSVHLVGGRPQYDLTVMDFSRWGMGGAVPRFRDTAEDGMNLMDRLCDKPDWISPATGREHHKSWFQLVIHPDARMMAAAPEMAAALRAILFQLTQGDKVFDRDDCITQARAAYAVATREAA
jgi:hypothetical protein